MTTVTIDGERFSCPFSGIFNPLTQDEYSKLLASVSEVGRILQPVLTCTIPDLGRCMIDGLHRHRVSEETGIPLYVADLGTLNFENAEIIARDANDRRRHLTPDQIAASRTERNALLLKLRGEGLSTREIAKRTGTTQSTVARQLSKNGSGDADESPEESSDYYVNGSDGKQYRQAPRASVRPSHKPNEDGEAEPIRMTLPDPVSPMTTAEFADAMRATETRGVAFNLIARTMRQLGYSEGIAVYESRWCRSASPGKRQSAKKKAKPNRSAKRS